MADWQDRLAQIAQRNRMEIVKAKLSRREMMRLGLLTASGSLVLKSGLSARAYAQTPIDDLTTPLKIPASPPTRPWVASMPILPVKQPIAPENCEYGYPDGTTLIDGGTKRVNHQFCSYNPNTGTWSGKFPPKKFYELRMKEAKAKLHPDYAETTYWGFEGMVPGPLIRAKYGEPVMIRYHNKLPSVKKAQAFGIAEMSTHLHNGHTPSESDGNPLDYFGSVNDPTATCPYGFRDQHYPNVYAGFTKYGTNLSNVGGDPREALGSLWFHDHHLDYTAQNVYKGMFGCYNLFDDLDTGVEGTGLNLPAGEFDVPMFFNDFVFDRDCQTVFDLFNLDGILGDKFAVNGAIQPFFNVKKRRYRFRLYNPGPARWYEFALWDGTNYIPFWQISTDGNLLPFPVKVTSVRQAVAERVDIVVDFSKVKSSRLYLVNRAEQVNGRGPTGRTLTPGTPLLQINIGATAPDATVDFDKVPNTKLRDLPDVDFASLQAKLNDSKVKKRTWRFERGNGAWTVNGKLFDEHVIDAEVGAETEEIWTIQNPGGSWRHPVHIHFEEFRVLSRNGVATKPATQVNGAIDYARRDVINLQTNEEVKVFIRFRDMPGRYVMHCHNVLHEDHAMMVQFKIV
jgi:FtsP/CotA-like multicopper oxidase with cupredoxin domain